MFGNKVRLQRVPRTSFGLPFENATKIIFVKRCRFLVEIQDFLKSETKKRIDSRQRMYENTKHLWQKLSGYDRELHNRLAMFVLQRCFLVVVSTSDLNSAYRIFAVMNDRGLDLSPTDILKAQIIGECEKEYPR